MPVREMGRADPVTLSEVIAGPVSFAQVAASVEAAMAGTLGGRWRRGELSEDEQVVAAGLQSHFESQEWTWRR
jgi:hypothetical protein